MQGKQFFYLDVLFLRIESLDSHTSSLGFSQSFSFTRRDFGAQFKVEIRSYLLQNRFVGTPPWILASSGTIKCAIITLVLISPPPRDDIRAITSQIKYGYERMLNLEQAKDLVLKVISETLEDRVDVSEETQLIGGDAILDSMALVEVCIALEDIADENGFEFDWTSEEAMSKSRSMFRSVRALAEEFSSQSSS